MSRALKLRRLVLTPLVALACVAVPMNAAAPASGDPERGFADTVQPFLNSYCISCHAGDKAPAQLDLKQYATSEAVIQDFSRWNRVLARLSAR